MANYNYNSSESDNDNFDKRVTCLQGDWVAIEVSDLKEHLQIIFKQMEDNFNVTITKCAILPASSAQRSMQARNSRTTSMFILTRNSEYQKLIDLFQGYRFHQHGWSVKKAQYVFNSKDDVSVNTTDCEECTMFSLYVGQKHHRIVYSQSSKPHDKYTQHTIDTTDKRVNGNQASQSTNIISRITTSSTISGAESIICHICSNPTTSQESTKPLIKRSDAPACAHRICLACLNTLAIFTTSTQYEWNGQPTISTQWRHKGAPQHVWVCPLCATASNQ